MNRKDHSACRQPKKAGGGGGVMTQEKDRTPKPQSLTDIDTFGDARPFDQPDVLVVEVESPDTRDRGPVSEGKVVGNLKSSWVEEFVALWCF